MQREEGGLAEATGERCGGAVPRDFPRSSRSRPRCRRVGLARAVKIWLMLGTVVAEIAVTLPTALAQPAATPPAAASPPAPQKKDAVAPSPPKTPAKKADDKKKAEEKKDAEKKGAAKKGKGAPAKGTPAKGAAPKANESPFAGFPGAIELPDPRSAMNGEPPRVTIGKLNVDPAALCLIYLKGGEEVGRGRGGKGRFELEELDPMGSESSWRISWVDGDSLEVAKIHRRGNDLSFAWSPAAAEKEDAKRLVNCQLELSAGKGKHLLALRKATRGQPVTIAFDEPTLVARWDVAMPPEPSRIKVELQMGSREPRYRFVGGSTISAARGSTWIEYMDRRSAEALKLKVDCEFKNGLQLTITPYFQVPGESQVVRFSPATYKKAREQADFAVRQLSAQLAAMPSASKKGGKGGGGSSPAAQLRGQLEKRLAAAQAAQSLLANVAEIRDAVDGKGKILVRATMEVEGQPVDLVLANRVK